MIDSKILVILVLFASASCSYNHKNSEVMPIVTVAPNYPKYAKDNRIEGEVTMNFTITKEGVVNKPRVISSIPSDRTFHREALRALLKFKYKPRMVDGKPVVTYATITLVFKL